MPRRRRSLTPKRIVAALGVATASLLLGWFIAAQTVSAINPFYRFAAPGAWRDPLPPVMASTQPPPVTFTPIGWGPGMVAEAPPVEPPPAPVLDAYDDAALLAGTDDAFTPLDPPLDLGPERRPVRVEAPAPPVPLDLAPPAPQPPAALDAAGPDIVPPR